MIPSDLTVECRRVQISEVLLNLLNNAYDAVEGTPGPLVEITVETNDHLVEISVTDSGKGISEEIAKKIMEPFFHYKSHK